MQETAIILVGIGGLLLLGLATDFLGRHTFLPRVTLLLLFGVLIGSELLDLVPATILDNYDLIANMTLVMIGFLLGGKLNREFLARRRRELLWISLSAVLVTSLLVFCGMLIIGMPLELAVITGSISAATAPAATVDVVDEANSKGPFSGLLLAIVAIDDAWGLILFSIGLAIVMSLTGNGDVSSPVIHAGREIGGALLVGAAIGLPAAFLTGRICPGRPMLTEALGLVLLCGGIAMWLDVSFLIAAMVMGAFVTNLASHHEYAFHEIENVEWLFLIVFFVLAGAQLEISSLQTIGIVGMVYILCRTVGKVVGAWMGGKLAGAGKQTCEWMGLALLPQAGVALGMALVAANAFPEYRQMLLSIMISTTIFFEIVGPLFTRAALKQAIHE